MISADILSVMIWVQTVCKGHQEKTNVPADKERVKCCEGMANSGDPDQSDPLEQSVQDLHSFLSPVLNIERKYIVI